MKPVLSRIGWVGLGLVIGVVMVLAGRKDEYTRLYCAGGGYRMTVHTSSIWGCLKNTNMRSEAGALSTLLAKYSAKHLVAQPRI